MQGYKTIVFNILMAAVIAIKMLAPEAEVPTDEVVAEQFDAVWAAIGTITAAGNTVLRFFTNTAIFRKGPVK